MVRIKEAVGDGKAALACFATRLMSDKRLLIDVVPVCLLVYVFINRSGREDLSQKLNCGMTQSKSAPTRETVLAFHPFLRRVSESVEDYPVSYDITRNRKSSETESVEGIHLLREKTPERTGVEG